MLYLNLFKVINNNIIFISILVTKLLALLIVRVSTHCHINTMINMKYVVDYCILFIIC